MTRRPLGPVPEARIEVRDDPAWGGEHLAVAEADGTVWGRYARTPAGLAAARERLKVRQAVEARMRTYRRNQARRGRAVAS